MWRLSCLLLVLFHSQMGSTQFGNDLASTIFQQVHKSLQSTQNLGSQIHAQVQQQLASGNDLASQIFQQVHENLRGTENLGSKIQAQVQQQLAAGFQNFGNNFMGFNNMGMNNLGSQISANIRQQLAPLQNLGARIQDQVNKQLMPVHALSIKANMIKGVGGTTIATYQGNQPRVFVIKNGIRQVCNGQVDGPQCYGSLEPFQIRTREDFCYARSYANVNNQICLAAGSINVQAINNQVTCYADGAPMLQLSRQEYQQLCGNVMPWQVHYRYYADPHDPQSIPIPNSNPHVTCFNNEPGVCEFEGTESTGGGGSGISSSSGFHFNYQNF